MTNALIQHRAKSLPVSGQREGLADEGHQIPGGTPRVGLPVDLATEIHTKRAMLDGAGGRYTFLFPGSGCLMCA